MHRNRYGDLVYRCSRDSNKVAKPRRFSLLENIQQYKLKNRDRRLSEPPQSIVKSPVIPSNLPQVADDLLVPNGRTTCGVPSLKDDNEGGRGTEGEGGSAEGEEEKNNDNCEVPFETTL